MDNNAWINNPRLRNMDPNKLKLLMEMASEMNGKSQKDMVPFLMAAATQSRAQGLAFKPDETDAIIDVLKIGKSKEEIQRIDKMKSMMRMMNK